MPWESWPLWLQVLAFALLLVGVVLFVLVSAPRIYKSRDQASEEMRSD